METEVGPGSEGLQGAAVATGEIQLVMHADAGVVEVEFSRIARKPLGVRAHALALGAELRIHLRVERGSGPGVMGLLRLAQSSLGSGERGAGRQPRLDQRVEPG